MSRQGRTMLAAMVALSAIGLAERSARADTLDLAAAGTGLAIAEACARHVAITVDPALSGRIAVTADADHPEEIGQIDAATVDGQARVGLRAGLRECWTPQPRARFDRTLVLRVRVPAGFPVSVREADLGDYAIGAVGPLAVSASGLMVLHADAVVGDASFNVSGTGTIVIAHLDADRLGASLSGTGSLHVEDGRIGTVKISDSGTANVRIDPVVDTAALSTSGAGSISLGGVRGALSRASSGSGRITVAGRAAMERDVDDD